MTVACVLRSGSHYSARWVQALRCGVERHAPGARFVCLTDVSAELLPGIAIVPLLHGWPGWWSKLELFRPGLFDGPVTYLDLDTLVVDTLPPLACYGGPFAMLSDFYRPKQAESGVMAWTPGVASERVWTMFVKNPQANINRYHRDGKFIAAHSAPDRLQDIYPGVVVSLKVHARRGPCEGSSLVCGHGRPRFDQPAAGWAHAHWLALAETIQPQELPA